MCIFLNEKIFELNYFKIKENFKSLLDELEIFVFNPDRINNLTKIY